MMLEDAPLAEELVKGDCSGEPAIALIASGDCSDQRGLPRACRYRRGMYTSCDWDRVPVQIASGGLSSPRCPS